MAAGLSLAAAAAAPCCRGDGDTDVVIVLAIAAAAGGGLPAAAATAAGVCCRCSAAAAAAAAAAPGAAGELSGVAAGLLLVSVSGCTVVLRDVKKLLMEDCLVALLALAAEEGAAAGLWGCC